MSGRLKLEFAPFATPAKGVLVLFCEEGVKFGPAARRALAPTGDLVMRAAAADRFKGKSGSALDLVAPPGLDVSRLVVIGVGKARDLNAQDFVKLGGGAGSLKTLGAVVEVLGIKEMKKLGMNALLGVGQGSEHESRTVIMRWNGGKRGAAPLAFIGKGVCFDTGGISIKPAGSMEDMKGDMAGAACVGGLMHALAARKAKVNALRAIRILENMVHGTAQP